MFKGIKSLMRQNDNIGKGEEKYENNSEESRSG